MSPHHSNQLLRQVGELAIRSLRVEQLSLPCTNHSTWERVPAPCQGSTVELTLFVERCPICGIMGGRELVLRL